MPQIELLHEAMAAARSFTQARGLRFRTMNPARKVIGWFRGSPAGASDPENLAEEERLRQERETVRNSQAYVGQYGPGMANMPPTPDVLHPNDDEG